MQNKTYPERKPDLSVDESWWWWLWGVGVWRGKGEAGGEEPVDSVEPEIDSNSQADQAVNDSENAMSVNEVTVPSISHANKTRKLHQKNTINAKI